MKNRENTHTKNEYITDFCALMAKARVVHQRLDSSIRLAQDEQTHQRVRRFIKERYRVFFPAIDMQSDADYVTNSFVFYCEDSEGNIVSTASLMVDSARGFAEEHIFKQDITRYRRQGLNSLQIGRFVIDGQSTATEAATLKDYFRLFYQFSTQLGFDIIVGLIKQKDIAFHQKLLGARILCHNTAIDYGGQHTFAIAAWRLNALKPRFFSWIGHRPAPAPMAANIYEGHQWDDYARSFASVQTSFQRELQLASAELLSGDVADFGCGSAKLAPFLADSAAITSYTGIDYSSSMIQIADWLIAQFDRPEFSTFEGKIEEYHGRTFDSAVSLNSYYTWPEPEKVLERIHQLLKKRGCFVLATPNTELDMAAMEKEARKELLTHPDYATFRQINLELTNNQCARFVEMDSLVGQLRHAGFAIVSCHQTFYLGGLNFVVAEKR